MKSTLYYKNFDKIVKEVTAVLIKNKVEKSTMQKLLKEFYKQKSEDSMR